MYLGEKARDGLNKGDKRRRREIRQCEKCTILVRPSCNGACYVQDERYIAGEHMDVRRDCVKFARFVGWVIYYPRGFPGWNNRCVTSNAPYGWYGVMDVRSVGWVIYYPRGFPGWIKRCVTSNAPYSRRPLAEMGSTQ